MKKILIIGLLMSGAAYAEAVPYRVEATGESMAAQSGKNDSEALARVRRFYVGGFYNFSTWSDLGNGTVKFKGENKGGLEAVAGVRVYDTFRLEANYYNLEAAWDSGFEMSGNTFMLNAIFDARMDSIYRMFKTQKLVPYVGVGAGFSMNEATGLEDWTSPVASVLAGLGIELGDRVAFDVGYRYMYVFESGEFDTGLGAHQFRGGIRVSF